MRTNKSLFLSQSEVDDIMRKINMALYVSGISNTEENDVGLHLFKDEIRGKAYFWSTKLKGRC